MSRNLVQYGQLLLTWKVWHATKLYFESHLMLERFHWMGWYNTILDTSFYNNWKLKWVLLLRTQNFCCVCSSGGQRTQTQILEKGQWEDDRQARNKVKKTLGCRQSIFINLEDDCLALLLGADRPGVGNLQWLQIWRKCSCGMSRHLYKMSCTWHCFQLSSQIVWCPAQTSLGRC